MPGAAAPGQRTLPARERKQAAEMQEEPSFSLLSTGHFQERTCSAVWGGSGWGAALCHSSGSLRNRPIPPCAVALRHAAWLGEGNGRTQRTWEPPDLCSPGSGGLHSPVSFLSPSKLETRSIFLERGGQYAHSDEEDGYESPDIKRRGASVDDFLKGSELGKPVSARWGAHRSSLPPPGSLGCETPGS